MQQCIMGQKYQCIVEIKKQDSNKSRQQISFGNILNSTKTTSVFEWRETIELIKCYNETHTVHNHQILATCYSGQRSHELPWGSKSPQSFHFAFIDFYQQARSAVAPTNYKLFSFHCVVICIVTYFFYHHNKLKKINKRNLKGWYSNI